MGILRTSALVITMLCCCQLRADDVVDSDAIVDVLSGEQATRALLVRERRPADGTSINLKIEFEFDSSELSAEAAAQLRQLLNAITDPRLSAYKFQIIGHTDAKGDDGYNLSLSQARARTVADFLVAGGVESTRLGTEGKGELELLYPHRPEDSGNRRVEIINMGSTDD